jgi:hypothetical protein
LKGVEACVRNPALYSGDSAKIRYAWDEKALYLLVEVKDDVHLQDRESSWLWAADCLQCGFCLEPWKEFQPSADPNADRFAMPLQTEVELGLSAKGPEAYRAFSMPEGAKLKNGSLNQAELPLSIVRDASTTVYEAAFPWPSLGLAKAPAPGSHIAVTIAVNDKDSPEQKDPSALSFFNGATGKKDRELMGLLQLGE